MTMPNYHGLLLAGDQMTPAGKIITYLIFPLIVVSVPVVFAALFRANRQRQERAVALAAAAEALNSRLNTQDAALARLLEVINPIGAPNLTAVLTRIQADGEAQAKRLDDHILAAAADKATFERRLEFILGESGNRG